MWISPPSLCWITTLLLASTLATILTKPAALIASAIKSASPAFPSAVTLSALPVDIAACATMLSDIVNPYD